MFSGGITYTQRIAGRIKIHGIDLGNGRFFWLWLDEYKNDEVPQEIKELIEKNLEKINQGYYNYTEKKLK